MTGRRRTIALGAALAALASASSPAAAQNLGSYEGIIEVSGVQSGPAVQYKAKIRVIMPVSSRDRSSISAEFLAGEAPEGKIEISQWDESDTDKSPDSEGQRNSYRCSLAAPVTLPVSVTGVLNVDTSAMEHTWSLTVLSLSDMKLNCVHSRSGPFTKEIGVAITTGTGVPGDQWRNPIRIASPSSISSQYVLDPTEYTQGQFGPINQKWQFSLK
jgi:hypothetical protein